MIKRKSSRPKNRRSARRRSLKTKAKRKNHKKKTQRGGGESTTAKFPRHSVEKALRIPRAIIEQNAGRECSDEDSSRFVGVVIAAFREAVLAAPEISTVYSHYRGEYLPDGPFFENALVDKFGIPALKVAEFTQIFLPHSARQISLKRRATSFEFSILQQVPKKLPAPKV
jgi:hypothetical protein